MSNFNSFEDDEQILMNNFEKYGTTRPIRPPENLTERKIIEFRNKLNTISKGDVYEGIIKDILKDYDEFFEIIHSES